jgi:hypothetical protein
MSFISWLRERTRTASPPDRARRRPAARAFRPQLEPLEDRSLPSTYYAATASDLIADVRAANKAGGANTILLTAPSTSPYVFTATDNTKYGNTVLPVISKGDNLTIQTSNGVLNDSDLLDARQFGRLFVVVAGASLTLKDVELGGGYVSGSGVANGGAVYNLGNLVVDHSVIGGNEAFGGYYATNGHHTGNDAAGGGIWSSGSLTIQNQSWIENNMVIGTGTGSGYGAGVCIAGGTANISSTTIGADPVSGWGGNWALGGYDPYTGTYAPFGPGAGYGGGIYVGAGTVTLTNDVIDDNEAGSSINGAFDGFDNKGYGGGIDIATGAAVFIDSYTVGMTFNNTASSSAGDIVGSYTLLP